ncbi:DnaD domain-containing protein [Ureibacillus thermosphaericus]|uniref:DnaD/phage-associated family protein n=1 Tax=Ureibacillus thermosphaericus TaxID=51173 RepID=A0A840Q0M9_URETH|nr:DnaD domain protein [Ureibacillus thermosphaericus]MBB5148626.1 DnaD/phage-associated family protein [Ureibacillus thermosphaericus]NKZ31342.1 DnaD domain protein [Ureibacillus thermosphaericus]
MNLLINEPPLQVLPSLAVKIGLNEAIVLQQAHYWLGKTTHEFEGYKWFYKTYEDWQTEFPFWSLATVRRVINSLEKQGYLISTDKYNALKIDKTKWYRIDYQKLVNSPSAQNEQSSCSNCTDELFNLSNKTAQIEHTNNHRLQHRLLTENTTEINNIDDDKEEQPAAKTSAFSFYEQNGFGTLSPYVAEKIGAWIDDLNEELVLEAMKLSTENNVRNWKYVETILKNWHNKNFKSLADVEADRKRFEAQKQQKNSRNRIHQEKIPDWFYKRNVDESHTEKTDDETVTEKNIDFEAERKRILAKLGVENNV